jgi:hypothetical protein
MMNIMLAQNTVQASLKDLLRSAAHFYSFNIAKEHEKESKKHLDFGTLAHAMFLEPQVFENEFSVLPSNAPKPPTDVMRNAKIHLPTLLHALSGGMHGKHRTVTKLRLLKNSLQALCVLSGI